MPSSERWSHGGAEGASLTPEPVAHLRARVVEIRTIEAGETCSYGATWRATGPSRIATLGIGYADGYRRALAGGDVETLRRTAIDFYERQDGARAAALLEKLLGSTSLEPREEAWTRYFLADAWRMAGEAERARVAARSAETAAARATVEPELDVT